MPTRATCPQAKAASVSNADGTTRQVIGLELPASVSDSALLEIASGAPTYEQQCVTQDAVVAELSGMFGALSVAK